MRRISSANHRGLQGCANPSCSPDPGGGDETHLPCNFVLSSDFTPGHLQNNLEHSVTDFDNHIFWCFNSHPQHPSQLPTERGEAQSSRLRHPPNRSAIVTRVACAYGGRTNTRYLLHCQSPAEIQHKTHLQVEVKKHR